MNLYKTTSGLLGKKFKLGSQHIDKGIDCFTLVINYLRNRNIEIAEDETFNNLTFETYKDAYLKNPQALMQVAIDYIKTKTDEIPLFKIMAGDILLIKSRNGNVSFGIDTGNGFAISISETDGVISLSKNDFEILGAYRCRV
jgi:hypothetical protein